MVTLPSCASAWHPVGSSLPSLARLTQPSPWVGPGKPNLPLGLRGIHVSVQQVQTPVRVPLEHLKLILAGGLGGPRSGPGDPTAADPAAGEPPGSELQEGVASRPRPGAVRGEAGNRREPPPLPGKGQRTGAGPQPDYRVPSPGVQEGCGMGQGHSPCPGSPNPPQIPENPAGLA